MNWRRSAQVAMYIPSWAQPCGAPLLFVICRARMRVPTKRIASMGQKAMVPFAFHCVRDEVPLPARQLFHRGCDPNEDEANEELHREVDHALHRHGDWRGVLGPLWVLNGEDRPDHCGNAKVDGDHDEPTGNCQACPKHLVVHRVVNITLTLLALLDAATKDQGNGDRKDALNHDRIGACIEAVLRPPLWRAVDWVHLQCTHAG